MTDRNPRSESQDRLLRQLKGDRPRRMTDIETVSVGFETVGNALYMRIVGRMITVRPDEMIEQIRKQLTGPHQYGIVLDLSACDYLCSSALALLIEAFDLSNRLGHQMIMLRPSRRIQNALRLLGFDQYFLIVDDEQMAHDYLAAQNLLKS